MAHPVWGYFRNDSILQYSVRISPGTQNIFLILIYVIFVCVTIYIVEQ